MSLWRQYRSTVVLSLAAIVLGLVVLWDRGRVTTSESSDRKFQLFDAWRPNDLREVRVTGGDYRIVLQRKRAGTGERHWLLEQDGRALGADEQEVEQLLLTLEYAGFGRPAALATSELGLTTPLMDISLAMGALRYRLRIGKPAPAPAGARYARVEGGGRRPQNYVVLRSLVDSLTKQLQRLRERRIVPFFSVEMQRVELRGHFVLERGTWGGRTAAAFAVVDGDRKRRASRRVVDAWLANLASFEAERFLSDKTPPAKDALALVFHSRDSKKSPVTLHVGGACPRKEGPPDNGSVLVVRQGPEAMACCVPKRVFDKLRVKSDAFIDTYVMGSAATDVSAWVTKSSGRIMDLARKGTGWVMRKPSGGNVDSAAASARLDAMVRWQGRLLEPAPAPEELGLTEPSAVVTLVALPERGTAESKEREEQFSIGTEVDGKVYVRRNDDGAVLELPAEAAELFNPSPSMLRGPEVWRRAMANVLAMRNECGPKPQQAERSLQGDWTLKQPSPSALQADMGSWNTLANLLTKLDAVRWVSEEPKPLHGFDAGCSIRMRMRIPESKGGGETDLELRIGAETQGGFYGRATGQSAVFVVPRPPIALARQWLLDRAALLVAPDRVRTVTFKNKGGSTLELGRGGSGWVIGGKATPQARRLGKTLEKLIAEGIVELGKGPSGTGSANQEPLATIRVNLREEAKPRILRVERADVWRGDKVYLVRDTAIDATFALLRSRVDPILDAL